MKLKRFIIFFFTIMFFSTLAISSKELKEPIFMGKVIEVTEASDGKTLMVKVKGYLKSCQVYEDEIIAIIGEETKILDECQNETKKNTNITLDIKKDDFVYIVFSNIFTNSLPPQSLAQEILISKSLD